MPELPAEPPYKVVCRGVSAHFVGPYNAFGYPSTWTPDYGPKFPTIIFAKYASIIIVIALNISISSLVEKYEGKIFDDRRWKAVFKKLIRW